MPDVMMPRLSDTMEEGVIARWLKSVGDQVAKGDVLAEIETDKATMDLEAFDEGVLEQILVEAGSTVPIGERIAVIGDGTATTPEAAGAEAPPKPVEAEPSPEPTEPEPEPQQAEATPSMSAPSAGATTGDGQERIRTSPLARKIAREHDLDLAEVTGTGPGGRIRRVDVDAAIAARDEAPEPAPKQAAPAEPAAAGPAVVSGRAPVDDEEIPLNAVRRITAQRLTQSAQEAPHFYLTSVVDVERLLTFRSEVNEQLATVDNKASVTDLLIRACALTLREHPQVNSSWADDKILRHHRIHIGIAVALDDGLIVPVVRDADRKSLSQIAEEARELATRARAGKLAPDEFKGSTFSISNMGMFGIDHFTAVINPPEAAILAVGAAIGEPVVLDGEVVVRRRMKLTMSVDHRVVDGAVGAAFLRDLKSLLEEPLRIVV